MKTTASLYSSYFAAHFIIYLSVNVTTSVMPSAPFYLISESRMKSFPHHTDKKWQGTLKFMFIKMSCIQEKKVRHDENYINYHCIFHTAQVDISSECRKYLACYLFWWNMCYSLHVVIPAQNEKFLVVADIKECTRVYMRIWWLIRLV